MPLSRQCRRPAGLAVLALLCLAPRLIAGGGPFNVLVVVNTNSADSVELGEYYAEKHGIPAHHVCRLGIATNLATLTTNEFYALLRNPITNHIATNGLSGQIDYLVLCQEFPTRINNAQGISASLFYGPRYGGTSGCYPPTSFTSNEYYRAERAFRSADGWSSTNGFVAFHLISSNLATSKLVVDRGAAAQSSFPSAAIYLNYYGDQDRGVREQLFDNAQFSFLSLPGLPIPCVINPRYQIMSGKTNVVGYHDGYVYILPVVRTNNVWVSGAFCDHLTSLGGRIPRDGQDNVIDWMHVGATASFGTVAEPCAYLEKFPDPLMGFYYARGFTVGEAYAMSVEAPYQGLFAGDPLAAPFAAPPVMTVTSQVPYQIVTGNVSVLVSAAARSNGVPAAQLDCYLDERFHTNLAVVAPTRFNKLSVVVGTRTNTAAVGLGDSLFDAVDALAEAVNDDALQTVAARARGDRLELVYDHFDHAGDNVAVSASVSTGAASDLTLGVGIASTNLVPSVYHARKTIYIEDNPWNAGAAAGDTLTCIVTLTNGVAITNVVVATNAEPRRSILERLMSAINANPTLMATNGVYYDRLCLTAAYVNYSGAFFARTPGPDGAGIQIDYSIAPASTNGLTTNFNFSAFLRDWPDDIRPRASVLFHVRPTNDVLTATAELDTTALPDGEHMLDFVARDGTAVAAASRLTVPIRVANTSLVLNVVSERGVPEPAAGNHFVPPETKLTNSVAAPAPSNGTQFVCTGWTLAGNEPLSGTGTNFTTTLTNHATLTWNWLAIPTNWFTGYGLTNDLAAAAWEDPEPDGFFTWQEYLADTDPTNAVSFPRMAFVETYQTNFPILTWPFSTGRLYSVQWCDDILGDQQWLIEPLGLGIGAWTDTNPPPATNRYYRIAPSIP